MRLLLFLLVFFALSPVMGQSPQDDATVNLVHIPEGETLVVQGIAITFLEVIEDSRCPKDVTCFWEGRARVLVEVSEGGKEPYRGELILRKIQRNEGGLMNHIYISEDLSFQFSALAPYPETTERTTPYILVLTF